MMINPRKPSRNCNRLRLSAKSCFSAPRCFEIEERLKKLLNIPVFHDDQHGTAIVVLAGIINALKVTGKKKENCKIVVNGAGSAGVAITKLLLTYGFPKITMCDINGIISADSPNLNWMQKEMTKVTNLDHETGTLADALKGADIFVGVSAPNIVSQEMVASMNKDAILFAMANPVPEIMPDLAKAAGAKVSLSPDSYERRSFGVFRKVVGLFALVMSKQVAESGRGKRRNCTFHPTDRAVATAHHG